MDSEISCFLVKQQLLNAYKPLSVQTTKYWGVGETSYVFALFFSTPLRILPWLLPRAGYWPEGTSSGRQRANSYFIILTNTDKMKDRRGASVDKACFRQMQKRIAYLTTEISVKWHYKKKKKFVTKLYNINSF